MEKLPLARVPRGRTFYMGPVTPGRVEFYQKELEAEKRGMGILDTVGKAALEIGKIAIPAAIQAVAGGAGAYLGARAAPAPPPMQVQPYPAPVAGAAPVARPKRIHGYIDPYTGQFVEKKPPRRRKKKPKRRYYRRRTRTGIQTDQLMQIALIKALAGGS